MHYHFLHSQAGRYLLNLMVGFFITLSIALSVTLSFTPKAQAKELGLGIIIFGPTGFSTNYFLDRKSSIDGAISWSLNNEYQDFYFHSTYLWHKPNSIKLDKLKLNAYFGIGGRMISWDHPRGRRGESVSKTEVGARGVVGTSHTFRSPSIEVFGELSLTMNVIPETNSDFDIAFGARYYF